MVKKLLLALALIVPTIAHADTFTPNIGFTKPTVGSVNWGPKLNTNWDLADSAIAARCLLSGCTMTGQLTVLSNIVVSGEVIGSSASFSTVTARNFLSVTQAAPARDPILNLALPNFPAEVDSSSGALAISGDGVSVLGYGQAGGGFAVARADGTRSAPTAVQSGEKLGEFIGLGYDGVSLDTVPEPRISFLAAENFTPSNHGTEIRFETVRNGSPLTRVLALKLANNGDAFFGGSVSFNGVLHISGEENAAASFPIVSGISFDGYGSATATVAVSTNSSRDLIAMQFAGAAGKMSRLLLTANPAGVGGTSPADILISSQASGLNFINLDAPNTNVNGALTVAPLQAGQDGEIDIANGSLTQIWQLGTLNSNGNFVLSDGFVDPVQMEPGTANNLFHLVSDTVAVNGQLTVSGRSDLQDSQSADSYVLRVGNGGAKQYSLWVSTTGQVAIDTTSFLGTEALNVDGEVKATTFNAVGSAYQMDGFTFLDASLHLIVNKADITTMTVQHIDVTTLNVTGSAPANLAGNLMVGGDVQIGGSSASTFSAAGYLTMANLLSAPSAARGRIYFDSNGDGALKISLDGSTFVSIATGTAGGGGGGGGGISGSGTPGQVAYFNGATSLASSPNMAWDGTELTLGAGGGAVVLDAPNGEIHASTFVAEGSAFEVGSTTISAQGVVIMPYGIDNTNPAIPLDANANGEVQIHGGNSSTGSGGRVLIAAGDTGGPAAGSPVDIKGGRAFPTQVGGAVTMSGGDGTLGGAGASIQAQGGQDGAGGQVRILAGSAINGFYADADVTIRSGINSGGRVFVQSGPNGVIQLNAGGDLQLNSINSNVALNASAGSTFIKTNGVTEWTLDSSGHIQVATSEDIQDASVADAFAFRVGNGTTQSLIVSTNGVNVGGGAISSTAPFVVSGNSTSGIMASFAGPSSGVGNFVEVTNSTGATSGYTGYVISSTPGNFEGDFHYDTTTGEVIVEKNGGGGFSFVAAGVKFHGTAAGIPQAKALCVNSSGVIATCTSTVDAGGSCTCP